MTLADVEEMWDYWLEHPPTHILLAGRFGYKPPQRPADTESDLASFFHSMTGQDLK